MMHSMVRKNRLSENGAQQCEVKSRSVKAIESSNQPIHGIGSLYAGVLAVSCASLSAITLAHIPVWAVIQTNVTRTPFVATFLHSEIV